MNKLCHDCKTAEATTFFVLGAQRCTPCAETFQANIHEKTRARWTAEKAAEAERLAKHNCDGSTDDLCSECCEHDFDPDEGFMCLHCGADGYEAMCDLAMSRCEGDR